MKNFKKIWLVSFLSIYLLAGALLFTPAQALAESSVFDVNQDVNFEPQVGIPGSEFVTGEKVPVGGKVLDNKGNTVVRSDLLAKYINAFYQWGLSIVAIVAVLVLMAGGLMWIASGGDSGLIGKAKDMIIGSLTGMALLIGAWFFLNTINPNLTQLPVLEMEIINKTVVGCCDENGAGRLSKASECAGTFFPNSKLSSQGQCERLICCVDITYGDSLCLKTYASGCEASSFWGDVSNGRSEFKIMQEDCSLVAECKDNTVSCEGVEEGGDCKGTNYDCWCYNGVAYKDKFGKEGEPCGNAPYSKCDKDEEQDGKTCDGDLGGRDCGEALFCCRFSEGGGRVND